MGVMRCEDSDRRFARVLDTPSWDEALAVADFIRDADNRWFARDRLMMWLGGTIDVPVGQLDTEDDGR